MRKAGVLSLFVVVLLAVAVADAQQPKKVSKIGYLSPSSPSADSARVEASGKVCVIWVTFKEKI
jgi:hypothetical protein